MADTYTVRNMRLVDPSGVALGSDEFRLNQRPTDLNGKTLGLLENHKANSDKVLHELGSLLKEKYDLKGRGLPEQTQRLSAHQAGNGPGYSGPGGRLDHGDW